MNAFTIEDINQLIQDPSVEQIMIVEDMPIHVCMLNDDKEKVEVKQITNVQPLNREACDHILQALNGNIPNTSVYDFELGNGIRVIVQKQIAESEQFKITLRKPVAIKISINELE